MTSITKHTNSLKTYAYVVLFAHLGIFTYFNPGLVLGFIFTIATFITKNLTGHTNNPITNKQKVIGALTGNIINTYFSYIGQTDK